MDLFNTSIYNNTENMYLIEQLCFVKNPEVLWMTISTKNKYCLNDKNVKKT